MLKAIIMVAVFLSFADCIRSLVLPSDFPLIERNENQEVNNQRFKRMNGKLKDAFRWPNKTVPYWINMTYFTNEHANEIDKAFKAMESVTCVRFVERSKEKDFVIFTGDTDHCSSNVGLRGGGQFIKLVNSSVGEGCFKVPSILHEIMHTLGFYHIHKSPDRDDHIKILWENVLPGKEYKLKKRTDSWALTDFDVGYDVDSILHYPKTSFSKNGKNTIETLDQTLNDRIGQRNCLSVKDIRRINRMYKCDV